MADRAERSTRRRRTDDRDDGDRRREEEKRDAEQASEEAATEQEETRGEEPAEEEAGDEREEDRDQEEGRDGDLEEDRDQEEGRDGDRDSGPSLSAKELTQAAMETLRDLTGFEPESAAGLQWDGESWLVTIDVLELERVPNTTDLLGTYVIQLDEGGGLLGYERTRRFLRGQVEGE
jgi:Gas vesicle synthesis protein GvpO